MATPATQAERPRSSNTKKEPPGEVLNHEPRPKIENYLIDISQANFQRFSLHIEPHSLGSKNKAFLVQRYLSKLKRLATKENDRDTLTLLGSMIFENASTFLLPPCDATILERYVLQASYFRGRKAGSWLSDEDYNAKENGQQAGEISKAPKVTSKWEEELVGDRLVELYGDISKNEAKPEGLQKVLQTFTVTVQKRSLDLDAFRENVGSYKLSKLDRKNNQMSLTALNKILLRQAENTPVVKVIGTKMFDMTGETAGADSAIEIRDGVTFQTTVVNGTLVRRLDPCLGLLTQAVSVEKLLEFFFRPADGGEIDYDNALTLLTTVTIEKTYARKKAVVRKVIGFAARTPDREIFFKNNKTTTVSQYLKERYDLNVGCQHRCVVVKNSKGAEEMLPTSLCRIQPGQLLPPSTAKYLEDRGNIEREEIFSLGSTLRDAFLRIYSDPATLAKFKIQKKLKDSYSANPSINSGIGKTISDQQTGLKALVQCSISPLISGKFDIHVNVTGKSTSSVEQQVLQSIWTPKKVMESYNHETLVVVFAPEHTDNLGKFNALEDLFTLVLKQALQTKDPKIRVAVFERRDEAWKDLLPTRRGVIGIFCEEKTALKRTRGPGASPVDHREEIGELRNCVRSLGTAFSGASLTFESDDFSFFSDGFKSDVGKRLRACLRRLDNQIVSSKMGTLRPPLSQPQGKILCLGIHVSAIQRVKSDMTPAELPPLTQYYLASIAAKWAGSTDTYKVKTSILGGQRDIVKRESVSSRPTPIEVTAISFGPYYYPGVSTLVKWGQNAIQSMLSEKDLKDSIIVVFRSGVPSKTVSRETIEWEEWEKMWQETKSPVPATPANNESTRKSNTKGEFEEMAQTTKAAALWIPPTNSSPRKTDTRKENTPPLQKSVAKGPLSHSNPKKRRAAARRALESGHLSEQSPKTLVQDDTLSEFEQQSTGNTLLADGKAVSKRLEFGGELPDCGGEAPDYGTEADVLEHFARGRGAQLAFFKVGSDAKICDCKLAARELEPDTELEEDASQIQIQPGEALLCPSLYDKTETAADSTEPAHAGYPRDFQLSKILKLRRGQDKKTTSNPLHLRLTHIESNSLLPKVEFALAETCFDFPSGHWSSKDLACLWVAKKANEDAHRHVDKRNVETGEPSSHVHGDLKNGQFFL